MQNTAIGINIFFSFINCTCQFDNLLVIH